MQLFNETEFFESAENEKLITEASLLVGMHPDEATDVIIDIGLKYNKPFAVVPCCVFSQKFPNRRKPHDPLAPVVSYEDLIAYLRAKNKQIQTDFLSFDGKNLVLYYQPEATGATEVAADCN
jgi:hypothetical protein